MEVLSLLTRKGEKTRNFLMEKKMNVDFLTKGEDVNTENYKISLKYW